MANLCMLVRPKKYKTFFNVIHKILADRLHGKIMNMSVNWFKHSLLPTTDRDDNSNQDQASQCLYQEPMVIVSELKYLKF